MPFNTPTSLGPFRVDAEGRLAPGSEEDFPSFSVVWRGCTVRATMTSTADHSKAPPPHPSTLALLALVGRVPSTAGANPVRAAERRAQIFSGLRCLPALLPSGWQVELRADHRVAIESKIHIPLPASAVNLVSAVTGILMELTPYLAVLAEAGLSDSGRSDAGRSDSGVSGPYLLGTENSCPG